MLETRNDMNVELLDTAMTAGSRLARLSPEFRFRRLKRWTAQPCFHSSHESGFPRLEPLADPLGTPALGVTNEK
ncbi:MAG: hypothetical protein JNM56_23260 [Planctomycetia bacterium]|nr:hypothetical protein [Planctomycetia bacterium]